MLDELAGIADSGVAGSDAAEVGVVEGGVADDDVVVAGAAEGSDVGWEDAADGAAGCMVGYSCSGVQLEEAELAPLAMGSSALELLALEPRELESLVPEPSAAGERVEGLAAAFDGDAAESHA